jgi:Protein of unknown function (DUF5818)
MRRETLLLIVLASILAVVPATFAQDSGAQVDPDLLNQYLGPQLIAWSQMQNPQPVPQPMPKTAPQPDPQPETQPVRGEKPANSQTAPQPTSQTVTGTIVKVNDKYVLKVAGRDAVYQLDDQEKAKQYEGKQVKIVGTLDASSSTLHVDSIELIS